MDVATAQGVARMFPGTLGGHSTITSPVSTIRRQARPRPPGRRRVWGIQEFAAGDEWWDTTGTPVGSILFPPDADSFDPDGVFPAWYAGGSDGTFNYHLAVDADGAWWVDKFNASMTVLLDRWPITLPTGSTGWEQKSDIPGGSSTSISEHAAAAIGNVLYVTGGYLRNVFGGPVTNFAWKYDEATDTWTSLANMPGARTDHASAASSTKVYVSGGQDGSSVVRNSLFEYNPATNTWSTKATMSTPRFVHPAAWCNGKLYVFGGVDDQFPGGTRLASAEAWNPGSNTWSAIATMPAVRYGAAAVTVGTDIYLFGGADSSDTAVDTVWKYDTLTDTWDTSLGAIPSAQGGTVGTGTAALLGSLIYIWGGVPGGIDDPVGGNLDKSSLWSYDPATDTWTDTGDPLPVFRWIVANTATSTHLYAVAGWSGSQTFNTLYRWSPSPASGSFVPFADIQHVTADPTNVVVVADLNDPVGAHEGYAVTVFDLAGTLLNQWTFDDSASLGQLTGSCLAGGTVYFVVRDAASEMKAVDLATGTITSLFFFTAVDAAITALDGSWAGTSDLPCGIVEESGDLIIATFGGLIRVQLDGTPVWWVATADDFRGLAHSGNGSVWVGISTFDADEYLYDGTYVQTITLPEAALQAWLGPSV